MNDKPSYWIYGWLVLVLLCLGSRTYAAPGTFRVGDKQFLLNGQPFVIKAAEIHYPRIPCEYWEHRIRMCKAMGMNTICLYVFWNIHEQREGMFDFSGQNDLATFCKLAQQQGMWVIIRPGPYVCAEWEMGGLPWWLLKKEDVALRSLDPYFMERTRIFMNRVGKELASLQISRGGNILMVQVENEMGAYGTDRPYVTAIRDIVKGAGFTDIPLFQCDWSSNFQNNTLDDLLWTINFGSGSNIDEQFGKLKELRPHTPLMCSEYWSGWFDHWGRKHETRSAEVLVKGMKDMLDKNISFSLYMAHGGTTFGHWGGGNCPPYSAMCSSYDYDAPISESGRTTPKFFEVRRLLGSYLPINEKLSEIPDSICTIGIPSFTLNQVAPLFDNLPTPVLSHDAKPMEQFDQGWGSILYRTRLKASVQSQMLRITEAHDWAQVFVDGVRMGILDRRKGDSTLVLPPVQADAVLDILVEAMGRVNFNKNIHDHKGITEKVELEGETGIVELKNWEIYSFPVDYYFAGSRDYGVVKGEITAPAYYRGNFHVTKTGDTFLDMRSWGKGMVWVNGHALGRFWKVGPQQTLYLPGCWLRKGANEIIILDISSPAKRTVTGIRAPILDMLRIEETELKGTPGQEQIPVQPDTVKALSSFFTEEKVLTATENIKKYPWAEAQKTEIVKQADHWLRLYTLEALWHMIPSQDIPRSMAVNSLSGCLVCGKAINNFGNYAYQFRMDEVDWQLTCPSCGIHFPTNDFKAYYQGGLDISGKFIPAQAQSANDRLIKEGKKGHLVNEYTLSSLSQEQLNRLKKAGISEATLKQMQSDPQWGVDNGMGYHFDLNDRTTMGNPYTFVAYYAHWALWYHRIIPLLYHFSNAYMFTRFSDVPALQERSQHYADAAWMMLDRIADLYPELHLSAFPRSGYYGFTNSDGHHSPQNRGRIIGSIWENSMIKEVMFAYDAVLPAIYHLSEKAKRVLAAKSHLPHKGEAANLKTNFEAGVLREIPKAFTAADLQGNPGMQQSTLVLAAVLINRFPETIDWLNLAYRTGYADWKGERPRDGGNIMNILVNRIDRDGQGDEVGLSYNALWLSNWLTVAKLMSGFTLPGVGCLEGGIIPDLFLNLRFRKLFEANYSLLLTEHYVPNIGDTGRTGSPEYGILNKEQLILGYANYPKDELAQTLYLLNGHTAEGLHLDLFSKDPERIVRQVEEVIARKGALKLPSRNLSAYGLAILRDNQSKEIDKQRALWLFYGARSSSHNHADPLNLGYIAYDLDLMPDFGYPNTLGGSANPEQQWGKSTVAHNTVSFDELGYNGHVVSYGQPEHFVGGGGIQMIHANCNDVQNSGKSYADLYDRTSALIRIDETDSYLVDFFRVSSPRAYTYNFHTAEVNSDSTVYNGLSFGGEASVTYHENTLRNVRAAQMVQPVFSVDWNIVDTWNRYGKGVRAATDIHLKTTILGSYEQVAVGEAVPPTNVHSNPPWVPILRLSAKGQTTFSIVMEPYRGKSRIRFVEVVPVKRGNRIANENVVRAIKVTLMNGRTDYIVNSTDTRSEYKVDGKFSFSGFWGVYSEDAHGKCIRTFICDGSRIGNLRTVNEVTGTVKGASSGLVLDNYIDILPDIRVSAERLIGRYIYIENKDIRETKDLRRYNAVYEITEVALSNNGCLRLHIGEASVVRGWNDIHDYAQGYSPDFHTEAAFRIPLVDSESY